MKLKFIEYNDSIYVVIGYTYDQTKEHPDCFVVVPLHKSIYTSLVIGTTLNIPIVHANEITEKKKLLTILVLYG
jgi:hypothetical protein